MNYHRYKKGIALLFTLIFLSVVLSISLGIYALIMGELKIGQDTAASHTAFHSAQSTLECLSYWDRRQQVFDNLSAAPTIQCFGQSINFPAATGGSRTVLVNFTDGSCVELEVVKSSGTLLRSRAQTACTAGARSVQRVRIKLGI